MNIFEKVSLKLFASIIVILLGLNVIYFLSSPDDGFNKGLYESLEPSTEKSFEENWDGAHEGAYKPSLEYDEAYDSDGYSEDIEYNGTEGEEPFIDNSEEDYIREYPDDSYEVLTEQELEVLQTELKEELDQLETELDDYKIEELNQLELEKIQRQEELNRFMELEQELSEEILNMNESEIPQGLSKEEYINMIVEDYRQTHTAGSADQPTEEYFDEDGLSTPDESVEELGEKPSEETSEEQPTE